MDKKSEEELERIANLVTREMVRSLNMPKNEQDLEEVNDDEEDGETVTDDDRAAQPPGKPKG